MDPQSPSQHQWIVVGDGNKSESSVKKVSLRLSALFRLGHSAVLPLLGLAFLAWSLVDPRPLPGIATVSLGQALGTAAFAIYVFVIARDLHRELLRAHADRR